MEGSYTIPSATLLGVGAGPLGVDTHTDRYQMPGDTDSSEMVTPCLSVLVGGPCDRERIGPRADSFDSTNGE